ncbi:MAG: hypothetical protein OXG68_07625 [Chloroflexi bacterium]|nr:hypothetical protein [Chloroflexota bacterium]
MNLKFAVIMIVAMGFVAPATAQVDNCCFVDRQCHSDRDWIDGFYAYQNNQCAGTAPSTSSAAGQIDNCCFVDRQCSSDQEWMDGYWAFQNNHCPASTASQSGTSTKPASNAAGQIDNCCFAGWQCNNDQDWINGYHAYLNNQCAEPPSTQHRSADSCCAHGWNCTFEGDWTLGRSVYAEYGGQCVVPAVQATVDGVIIEGSTWFFNQVNAILDYLKRHAPEWHAYVVKGPLKVRERSWGDTTGRGSFISFALGNLIVLHPRTIAGNQPARSYTLIHEACHVQRHIAGLLRYGTQLEQRIEETLCDLVGVYMIDSARPAGYSSKYVTARADQLVDDGITNFYELAQAERERAFHLLATMS